MSWNKKRIEVTTSVVTSSSLAIVVPWHFFPFKIIFQGPEDKAVCRFSFYKTKSGANETLAPQCFISKRKVKRKGAKEKPSLREAKASAEQLYGEMERRKEEKKKKKEKNEYAPTFRLYWVQTTRRENSASLFGYDSLHCNDAEAGSKG